MDKQWLNDRIKSTVPEEYWNVVKETLQEFLTSRPHYSEQFELLLTIADHAAKFGKDYTLQQLNEVLPYFESSMDELGVSGDQVRSAADSVKWVLKRNIVDSGTRTSVLILSNRVFNIKATQDRPEINGREIWLYIKDDTDARRVVLYNDDMEKGKDLLPLHFYEISLVTDGGVVKFPRNVMPRELTDHFDYKELANRFKNIYTDARSIQDKEEFIRNNTKGKIYITGFVYSITKSKDYGSRITVHVDNPNGLP
ncbi:MAG: hypothetical protein QXU98_04650, partial [Candidatus Parvarchaeota archaeon]